MDWARAKTVLIVVFFILNIFLLINLYIINPKDSVSKETIINTANILASKGISLKCDIPVYRTNEVSLYYDNNDYDRQKIVKSLIPEAAASAGSQKNGEEITRGEKSLVFLNNNFFSFSDKSPNETVSIKKNYSVESFLKKKMSSMGIPYSKYQMDDFRDNLNGSVWIRLVENYEGFLLLDNFVEGVISEKGMSELKSSKLNSFAASRKKLLPAHHILLKNSNELAGSTITAIERAFKNRYLWRISLKDKGYIFIDAITGDLIKQDK